MGRNKEEIEAYKTLDSSYYLVDIEVEDKYKDILNNINTCITNYIDNPNNIIEPKNNKQIVLLLKYIRNKYLYKFDGIINNSKNIDINIINVLWDIYTNICYKLLINPTIQRFTIFININQSTIKDWANNRDRPNTIYSTSAKKWLDECESALYDDAISNNSIGSIFALKANFGYKEGLVIETNNNIPEKTVEEIAMDYTNQITENNNNTIDF